MSKIELLPFPVAFLGSGSPLRQCRDKYPHQSDTDLDRSKEEIGIFDEMQHSVCPPVAIIDSLLKTCLA